MPITAEGLLNQAAAIACNDELSSRLVVNRAYYAAFHIAKEFHDNLPQPGAMPTNGCGVHETLFHCLRNPIGSIGDDLKTKSRQIAMIGKEIKSYRRNADYELSTSVQPSHANYVVDQAKKVSKLAA